MMINSSVKQNCKIDIELYSLNIHADFKYQNQ